MTSITQLLEEAERSLAERSTAIKKLSNRLSKSRKELAKGGRHLTLLRALIEEVRKLPKEPDGPNWDALANTLARHESDLSANMTKEFPVALRNATEAAKLPFRVAGGIFCIGPFGVRADYAKDVAVFEYAKIEIAKDLPLDPENIVTEVERLRESLLSRLEDPKAFAQQLEEAIRVVLTRQRKSLMAEELRAELPLVYREMLYLRQGWNNPAAKRKLTEYPVARFVVETKSFLQSDANLKSARPFRLEPAVIENTKNLSKAFFFPKDLADGNGEGMYFQAVLLTKPH